MFQKILCPVDFTEDSTNAAEYSNELAILSGAELILVHIKNLMAVSAGRLPMESGDLVTDVENIAKDQIRALVNKLSEKNKSGKIKAFFKAGINTGEELINLMNEHKPDLVVMYTGGISGVGDYITGTKTDRIIDKTSVPLLLIPGSAKFTSGGSIVYTTDNKGNDTTNLSYSVNFAKLLNAHTYVLHVGGEKGEVKFNESLKISGDKISFESIVSKDVNEGIKEFAASKNSGIIVMNTYTRSFFEKIFSPSFTKNMSYNLQHPLLILDKD